MLPALQTLQRDGAAIARYADDITKAELIGPQETHAEKSAALVQFIATRTHQLGGAIAYLIDDCAPTAAYAGVAAHPGAYPILREAFAPLLRFRDLKSPDTIVAAAKVAIECTTWVLTHAGELISAATRQQSLQTVRDSEEAE